MIEKKDVQQEKAGLYTEIADSLRFSAAAVPAAVWHGVITVAEKLSAYTKPVDENTAAWETICMTPEDTGETEMLPLRNDTVEVWEAREKVFGTESAGAYLTVPRVVK